MSNRADRDLQNTVDAFLVHVRVCKQCINEPFNLCRLGERLLNGIGLVMPMSPTISIDVKYTPDETAKKNQA